MLNRYYHWLLVLQVAKLIQFLIEHCCDVFGHTIMTLLGDLEEQESIDKSGKYCSSINPILLYY